MPGAVFFDFFGTLAAYPADGREDLTATHAVLGELGCPLGYRDFRSTWAATWTRFEEHSRVDDREFALDRLATVFLRTALDRAPRTAEVDRFLDCYLREWRCAVRIPAGLGTLLREVGAARTLAVVTNTHSRNLVGSLLVEAGLRDAFAAVVTSVEVGRRKPHLSIYASACARVGVAPGDVVFVGDTFEADYAGPTRFGMTAYLIDPDGRDPVPPERRLGSVFDIVTALES